jgi:phosphoglycolate phosphatase
MVGDGAATLVARAFAASGAAQPPDALARFLAVYASRLLRFTRPYDGIVELLDELDRRVALAVLTNKPFAAATSILEGLGLSKYFSQRVIGGDGPVPRKPNPAGLSALTVQAGVHASRTLMVGDSLVDWQTAHAGQAKCCIARYGFGFAGFPVHEATPDDRFIDQPGDVLSLV